MRRAQKKRGKARGSDKPLQPRRRTVKGRLLDGLPLGSSATVKPNDTGGLDVFVIRAYPRDDPPKDG